MENSTITEKRKYKKHKIEGVVSIVHFPNTKIKPTIIYGNSYYPLYIRITVKKQVTTIKSLVNGTYDSIDFIKSFPDTDACKLMELEKIVIEEIVKSCKPFTNENFSISQISGIYSELMNCINFFSTELMIDWIQEFIKDFAVKNKINKDLFLSIINLKKDTLSSVIEAFSNLSEPIKALKNTNHIPFIVLSDVFSDKKVFNKFIFDGKPNKELYDLVNEKFFKDTAYFYSPEINNLVN